MFVNYLLYCVNIESIKFRNFFHFEIFDASKKNLMLKKILFITAKNSLQKENIIMNI